MITCKVPECKFITESAQSFITHYNSIHRSGPKSLFTCGYSTCVRRFSLYSSFSTHLFTDHKYITHTSSTNLHGDSSTLGVNELPSLVCEHCNRQFYTVYDLAAHLVTHFDLKTVVRCPYQGCDKEYINSHKSLTAHISKTHPKPLANVVKSDALISSSTSSADHNLQETTDTPSETDHIATLAIVEESRSTDKHSLIRSLAHFYITLVSKSHVPESTTQLIHEKFSAIITLTLDFVKRDLAERLSPHLDDELIRGILYDVFCEASAIGPWFSGSGRQDPLRSKYTRREYYEQNFKYVAPVGMNLGKNKLNKDSHYHYVPIIESLETFLSDETVYKQYCSKSKEDRSSSLDEYTDIHDGSYMKAHPLFFHDKMAIQIILFQDEFLVANPLGASKRDLKILGASKRDLKMLGVYYTIGNIQPWNRSKVDPIQLVLLCKSQDLKYFGQEKVFGQQLLPDLKRLEQTGVCLNGEFVRAAVTFIVGDNLGSHYLGGFMENFSAAHYLCRVCDIRREDFHSGSISGTIRTPDSYDIAAASLGPSPAIGESSDGIRFSSIFNSLGFFHVVNGMPPCIGHDIFEGIAQYDLPLAFGYFEEMGWFTIEYLNRRIGKMKYNGIDSNDRPCPVSTTQKLGGHAVQTWTLIRMLPLLIGHTIKDKKNRVWQMVLNLIVIVQIVCSPRLTSELISLLSNTIRNYMKTRRTEFANTKLRPKHHYIEHYPRLISMYGPLIRLWTLRFESKHKYLKECQRSAKNTKNVTMTLAIKHQYLQASYQQEGLFSNEVTMDKGNDYWPDLYSPLINNAIKSQPLLKDTKIVIGTECTYHNISYKRDDFVVLKSDLVLNLLKIISIVITNQDNVFLIGKVAAGTLLENVQLYQVEESSHVECLSIADLQDHHPYKVYDSSGFPVIALKHLTS